MLMRIKKYGNKHIFKAWCCQLLTEHILTMLLIVLLAHQALADIGGVTGLHIPRFVSLKAKEVNLRSGPGINYPLKFSYQCKYYPLEVRAELEHWRLLHDKDGSEGWVHQSLISGVRYAVINAATVNAKLTYQIPDGEGLLFRQPSEVSYPVLRVPLGSIGKIQECNENWCLLKVNDVYGWVKKGNLWGIYIDEIITQ